MKTSLFFLLPLLALACANTKTPPADAGSDNAPSAEPGPAPTDTAPTNTPPDATGELPPAPAPRSELLTASACKERGGKVIGDIGDGAVHRPDYKCPDSGKAPIGGIKSDPGGPIATEGAVCCL